jgi:hypothetical protein
MIEENGRRKHVVPTPLTPEMDKSLQFNPNLCSNNVSTLRVMSDSCMGADKRSICELTLITD